jgi:hypothetical protein
MNQAVVGAALVPGMPHLLAAEPAPSWKLLADAARQAGQDLRAAGPDAFVVLSTSPPSTASPGMAAATPHGGA